MNTFLLQRTLNRLTFQVKPFVLCFSAPESMRALYVSVLIYSLLLVFLPPAGMSPAHTWHRLIDLTLKYIIIILTWQTRCEIMFTLLFVSVFFDRSRGERCSRQEGGEGETKPTLLGSLVVRLFRVVGGATGPGSSRRDA